MILLSPAWRKAHRRYSVWALTASAVIPNMWATIGDPPLWGVLVANAVIGGLGLIGAYLAQPNVTGEEDADSKTG